jgi:hypothetical protein
MSLRLDSISNRAIAKFLFFFITTMSLILMICIVYLLALFLVFFGIWAGIAGTALYFIITRWPEAAVLAPCFVALVLSGAGLLAVWHWGDYLEDPSLRWMENCLELVKNLWPEEWITDAVDDEDLDREGVPTYARQGIFFPSK